MKRKFIAVCIVLCVAAAVMSGCTGKSGELGNAKEVFRLHILANSDSDEDQQGKLYVRDRILEYMNEKEFQSKEEALEFARENKAELEQVAQEALQRLGFDYGAEAEIGVFSFPTVSYGETVYPAGEYDALRIKLGAAQGHNWWCVMFPPLCLLDISYAQARDDLFDDSEAMYGVEPTAVVEYESLFEKIWRAIFGGN